MDDASKSKTGSAFQARLLEPVLVNDRVVIPRREHVRGQGSEENSASMGITGGIAASSFH